MDPLPAAVRTGARRPGASTGIKRFDGIRRTATDWNGPDRVRTPAGEHDGSALTQPQDSDLLFDHGDCLVHFNEPGAPQRVPVIKVSHARLQATRCRYLLDRCRRDRRSVSPSSPGASDSGYESAVGGVRELHLPPPSSLSRDQAVDYNMTSRNYFAMLMDRPLVGRRLNVALTALWRRLAQWQPDDPPFPAFTSYCRRQGYFHLANSPRHATAVLAFAETARLAGPWTNAFAHCVGMHDRLDLDSEYADLPAATRGLITRASLEMDLRIARALRALRNFLEDELGAEQLGLSKSARDHLDRFRSWLQAYYVQQYGWFPPPANTAFNRPLWSGMHDDFRSLYDLLVDTDSENDLTVGLGVVGGVCVLQNVHAFNRRHGHSGLPHPLPLLPSDATLDSQRTLRNFKLGRTGSEPRPATRLALALTKASNSHRPGVLASPIVQGYLRFERQRLEEKLSVAEARKVRWILIYCVLQMLHSVVRAPEGVEDTHAPYPLCVPTDGGPDFDHEPGPLHAPPTPAALESQPDDDNADRISIRPDCEADSAQDYFSLSRRGSQLDVLDEKTAGPQPLRISIPVARATSIRTSVHSSMNALHKSVVGSLSRRNSIMKTPQSATQSPTARKGAFSYILVEGYGNGATPEPFDRDTFSSPKPNALAEFDFGLSESQSEESEEPPVPLLEDHQLAAALALDPMSASEASTRGSSWISDLDSPITQPSSRSNSTREPGYSTVSTSGPAVYVPTGSVGPPISKFAPQQKKIVFQHREGIFPEEDEPRGRRRSRTLDRSARLSSDA